VLTILSDLTPASAVFLAVGGYAGLSVPVLLFPGMTLADVDPRPVVRDALEFGRLQPVWQAAVDAGHTTNRGIALAELHAKQARDRARLALVSALLVAATHLSPSASKKGATHV
jgi:hypothetical protein